MEGKPGGSRQAALSTRKPRTRPELSAAHSAGVSAVAGGSKSHHRPCYNTQGVSGHCQAAQEDYVTAGPGLGALTERCGSTGGSGWADVNPGKVSRVSALRQRNKRRAGPNKQGFVTCNA